MNTSPAQKLIVSLICQATMPAPKRDLDFDFIDKFVCANDWVIFEKYPHLRGDQETKNPAEYLDVLNLLGVCRIMKSSYDDLSPQEKQTINAQKRFPSDGNFYKGFDGNSGPHKEIADIIFDDLNLFQELKIDSNNSHYDTTGEYSNLVNAAQSLIDEMHEKNRNRPRAGLSIDDLTNILHQIYA